MNDINKYIAISEAATILNVSVERTTWFITIGRLSSIQNKNGKLVSLQDVCELQAFPHLLAQWVIYALVDPRDETVRYVGQTNEPLIRFKRHLSDRSNPERYKWVQELRECGLRPQFRGIGRYKYISGYC